MYCIFSPVCSSIQGVVEVRATRTVDREVHTNSIPKLKMRAHCDSNIKIKGLEIDRDLILIFY